MLRLNNPDDREKRAADGPAFARIPGDLQRSIDEYDRLESQMRRVLEESGVLESMALAQEAASQVLPIATEVMDRYREITALYRPSDFVRMAEAARMMQEIKLAGIPWQTTIEGLATEAQRYAEEERRRREMLLSMLPRSADVYSKPLSPAHPEERRAPWLAWPPYRPIMISPYSREGHHGATTTEVTEYSFGFDGKTWALTFAGKTEHFPDRKGFRYIVILLRRPGRSVGAEELIKVVHTQSERGWGNGGDQARDSALESVGLILPAPPTDRVVHDYEEMIDSRARTETEARLKKLEKDRKTFLALGDHDRVGRIEQETDQILRYLMAATNRKGRTRSFSDSAEKARKSVQKAVRAALELTRTAHPQLYQHLKSSIHFGHRLCYDPGIEILWFT